MPGTLSPARRGGRAVECGGLENRYRRFRRSRVQIPPPPLHMPQSRSTSAAAATPDPRLGVRPSPLKSAGFGWLTGGIGRTHRARVHARDDYDRPRRQLAGARGSLRRVQPPRTASSLSRRPRRSPSGRGQHNDKCDDGREPSTIASRAQECRGEGAAEQESKDGSRRAVHGVFSLLSEWICAPVVRRMHGTTRSAGSPAR